MLTDEELENFPVKFGEVVVIRTVAYYYMGVVTRITHAGPMYFVHLSDASVIENSDEWHKAIKTGKMQKCDALGQETRIALGATYEITPWPHKLIG